MLDISIHDATIVRMDMWERVRNTLDEGLESSRKLLGKAGEKARDLGEKGVLRFEIFKMESQLTKSTARLGTEVYTLLAEERKATVSEKTKGIGEILSEIGSLKVRIIEKEREMKADKPN